MEKSCPAIRRITDSIVFSLYDYKSHDERFKNVCRELCQCFDYEEGLDKLNVKKVSLDGVPDYTIPTLKRIHGAFLQNNGWDRHIKNISLNFFIQRKYNYDLSQGILTKMGSGYSKIKFDRDYRVKIFRK